MPASAPRPRRPFPRAATALGTAALLGGALIAWAFAGTATSGQLRGWLFLLAVAALLVALRRHVWPALVVTGVMALGMHDSLPRTPGVWGWIFLLATSAGLAMWLRKLEGMRWFIASFPVWVFAKDSTGFTAAALVLMVGGIAIEAVGPTLPTRRRRRRGEPLPHLAGGPLVAPLPQTYPYARRSRPLEILTIGFAILTVVLFIVTGRSQDPDTPGALTLSSLIITVTFAGSLWFNSRVRVRVDHDGMHGRTVFREHSIRWPEVSALTMRYVFLGMGNVRIVYYTVRSPTQEISFPSSMKGAKDLQAVIEGATGLQWPEPTMTPNF